MPYSGQDFPERYLYTNDCDRCGQLLLDSEYFSLIKFNPRGLLMNNLGFFFGKNKKVKSRRALF